MQQIYGGMARLQAWDKKQEYGILWNSSRQNYGGRNVFYCMALKNSEAEQKGYCKYIGGADKIQSPTDSKFYWYRL
jgi:hypothetical protein